VTQTDHRLANWAWRLAIQTHFRSVHDRQADLAGGDVDLCGASEAVVVGDGQGCVAQLARATNEIIGMRGSVQKAVVRVSVEFGVSCHTDTLIEHMFDRHGEVE
jgi:hypothetical protein